METFDIILTTDSGLIEVDGDFFTGENDNNLMYYNVVSHQGHFRTSPTLGAGVDSYLNENANGEIIARNIKTALAADIFDNAKVDASNFPTIIINKELVISNGDS